MQLEWKGQNRGKETQGLLQLYGIGLELKTWITGN